MQEQLSTILIEEMYSISAAGRPAFKVSGQTPNNSTNDAPAGLNVSGPNPLAELVHKCCYQVATPDPICYRAATSDPICKCCYQWAEPIHLCCYQVATSDPICYQEIHIRPDLLSGKPHWARSVSVVISGLNQSVRAVIGWPHRTRSVIGQATANLICKHHYQQPQPIRSVCTVIR